ncbi:MAG: hypothetical protein JXB24_09135 [Bacteroidales bacterium]|nr:hypothetical protein [Bacteroidales bacterium]
MELNVLNKIYDFIHGFIHPNELKLHIPGAHREENDSPQKKCPVTGLDISMQPRGSKFLSYTGVKWYYEHDYKTYCEILSPRLTDTWKESTIEFQFREIAHSIRNSDSNPRNNTRRKISKILDDKNSLFNNFDLIDKRKLKEAGLVQ